MGVGITTHHEETAYRSNTDGCHSLSSLLSAADEPEELDDLHDEQIPPPLDPMRTIQLEYSRRDQTTEATAQLLTNIQRRQSFAELFLSVPSREKVNHTWRYVRILASRGS